MNRQSTPASEIAETEHLWITMPDGVRLAARLWLPRGAWTSPVPAILEYIPYRKRDMVRARDERNHPVFAAQGYASLRVDMRGSGDSDGVMADMYSDEELSDARHVIDWISRQRWCNGRVGMFGTSWGGTASLQASVDAPPALKAVIAVCATHDRYEDDIHHMGGCLLTDSIEWGATLPAILASPPDAATVGPDWFEQWKERLEALTFPLETWIREEARGAYWRRGSVKHVSNRISCPVFAVGGWCDRYSNSVMSLVDARPDLVWGMVGPWSHHYPDKAHPGPAVGFQALALNWWDHWLKGVPTDVEGWPRLQVWLSEFDPPQDALDRRAGEWIATGTTADVTVARRWAAAGTDLVPAIHGEKSPRQIPWDLSVGAAGGDTGYFGRYGGLPLDQHEEDERALSFDTAPLDEDLVLYGAASVDLVVETTDPRAQFALRLNDVAPDGTSSRVALSVRNLALDDQLDEPSRPHPAGPRKVRIALPSRAYRFRAGHRLRLSISSSYWPMVWPAPTASKIHVAACGLTLPSLVTGTVSAPVSLPAATKSQSWHETLSAPLIRRVSERSPDSTLHGGWHQPWLVQRFPATGTTFGYDTRWEHRIDPSDPLSADCRFDHQMRFEREDGVAEVRSTARVTCNVDEFILEGEVEAAWNGETIFRRAWNPRVPRRLS